MVQIPLFVPFQRTLSSLTLQSIQILMIIRKSIKESIPLTYALFPTSPIRHLFFIPFFIPSNLSHKK